VQSSPTFPKLGTLLRLATTCSQARWRHQGQTGRAGSNGRHLHMQCPSRWSGLQATSAGVSARHGPHIRMQATSLSCGMRSKTPLQVGIINFCTPRFWVQTNCIQRIMRFAPGSKPVRAVHKTCLINGLKDQQHRHLNHSCHLHQLFGLKWGWLARSHSGGTTENPAPRPMETICREVFEVGISLLGWESPVDGLPRPPWGCLPVFHLKLADQWFDEIGGGRNRRVCKPIVADEETYLRT